MNKTHSFGIQNMSWVWVMENAQYTVCRVVDCTNLVLMCVFNIFYSMLFFIKCNFHFAWRHVRDPSKIMHMQCAQWIRKRTSCVWLLFCAEYFFLNSWINFAEVQTKALLFSMFTICRLSNKVFIIWNNVFLPVFLWTKFNLSQLQKLANLLFGPIGAP